MAIALSPLRTDRLRLDRPTDDDLDALFRLCADERVWRHYPSLRHTDHAQTAAMVDRWQRSWDRAGLGTWTLRSRTDDRLIGYGGCSLIGDEATVWNLGYRIDADEHGHGYATEVSRAAIARARATRPDTPIVAYLVEHNAASARVAEKIGFSLVHRGPDAGNPDPSVIRLVYADRPLTSAQLAVVLS
ncbi:GNAT family N-acetyltransferase [Microbacterium gorillae]|uniref:GNAT family N-acetyltransferase n=1 Tax=Microbacterium gorillae TaxID=1231063 RepID=UPI00058BCE0F|nr:GNAT family N-acetyltransferase [Microbacterium gorillae]